jgi:DNA-binding response OmpR family regulator
MAKVLKILLIEDDKLDQAHFKRALDKKGILCKVRIAQNGEDGLSALQSADHKEFHNDPDIIILDVSTPKTNGFEFLERLRKNKKWDRIKVFVLTDSEHEKKKFSKVRVSGFITKPLDFKSPSSDTLSLLVDMVNI